MIDHISALPKEANQTANDISYRKIYKAKDVVDIELAGHRIIGFLLDTFITAATDDNPKGKYSELVLSRVSEQFETDAPTLYGRILAILDFISGMTDVYALDLYRKLTGMSLPSV